MASLADRPPVMGVGEKQHKKKRHDKKEKKHKKKDRKHKSDKSKSDSPVTPQLAAVPPSSAHFNGIWSKALPSPTRHRTTMNYEPKSSAPSTSAAAVPRTKSVIVRTGSKQYDEITQLANGSARDQILSQFVQQIEPSLLSMERTVYQMRVLMNVSAGLVPPEKLSSWNTSEGVASRLMLLSTQMSTTLSLLELGVKEAGRAAQQEAESEAVQSQPLSTASQQYPAVPAPTPTESPSGSLIGGGKSIPLAGRTVASTANQSPKRDFNNRKSAPPNSLARNDTGGTRFRLEDSLDFFVRMPSLPPTSPKPRDASPATAL